MNAVARTAAGLSGPPSSTPAHVRRSPPARKELSIQHGVLAKRHQHLLYKQKNPRRRIDPRTRFARSSCVHTSLLLQTLRTLQPAPAIDRLVPLVLGQQRDGFVSASGLSNQSALARSQIEVAP